MTRSIAAFLLRREEKYVKILKQKVSKLVEVGEADLLKVQITPTPALSFRIIKVNVTRESREHSFSQDNMENFTAFIPS